MAIVSTSNAIGQVWVSMLIGEPGFIQVIENKAVKVTPTFISDAQVYDRLKLHSEIGILVIDLATRRRLRLNGHATVHSNGSLEVCTQQVYFNCPKYIQKRHLQLEKTQCSGACEIVQSKTLTISQQQWIKQADTFFIGSAHPESGMDASHRGGNPGFVQVLNETQILFPDYSGNDMFNTLGNIHSNPKAGLLFIDFEHGNLLQLAGDAYIMWDKARTAAMTGAERLVEFSVAQVKQITDASPLRWQLIDYSPFNPSQAIAPNLLI